MSRTALGRGMRTHVHIFKRSLATHASPCHDRRDTLMNTTRLKALACRMVVLASFACTAAHAQTGVSPAEARAIAKEAYIYGFPMVDNYRIQYSYFVDRQNAE